MEMSSKWRPSLSSMQRRLERKVGVMESPVKRYNFVVTPLNVTTREPSDGDWVSWAEHKTRMGMISGLLEEAEERIKELENAVKELGVENKKLMEALSGKRPE